MYSISPSIIEDSVTDLKFFSDLLTFRASARMLTPLSVILLPSRLWGDEIIIHSLHYDMHQLCSDWFSFGASARMPVPLPAILLPLRLGKMNLTTTTTVWFMHKTKNTHGMYSGHEWLQAWIAEDSATDFKSCNDLCTYTYCRVFKAAFRRALATAVIPSTSILLLLRLEEWMIEPNWWCTSTSVTLQGRILWIGQLSGHYQRQVHSTGQYYISIR